MLRSVTSILGVSQTMLPNIPVMVGSDIVQLSIPMDLLCALLLTKQQSIDSNRECSTSYTLHDVLAASENLKRFREIASTAPTDSSIMSDLTAKSSVMLPGSNNTTNIAAAFSANVVATPSLQSSRVSSPAILTTPSVTNFSSGDGLLPFPIENGNFVDIVGLSIDGSPNGGSAIVQEMLSKANEFELDLILNQLITNIVLVSVNTNGCRVVQKFLERASQEQSYRLCKAIPQYKIIDLCIDVNGNHVMQKLVECLSQSALHELVTSVFSDPIAIARLSVHSYGCRVIQRLIVKCQTGDDRSTILCSVIANFENLVSDQFGNYVAQHSIEYANDCEKRQIISVLASIDVVGLCCNKFASNVVEKAIRVSKNVTGNTNTDSGCFYNDNNLMALHRLVTSIIQTEEALIGLMKDKYGNYVIKAICDLNPVEFPQVVYVKDVLFRNSDMLKKYTYGFHLVDKMEKSCAAAVIAAIHRDQRITGGSMDYTPLSPIRTYSNEQHHLR